MVRILLFVSKGRGSRGEEGNPSVTALDHEVGERLHGALRLTVDEGLDARACMRHDLTRALEGALDAVMTRDALGDLAHLVVLRRAARRALKREALQQCRD